MDESSTSGSTASLTGGRQSRLQAIERATRGTVLGCILQPLLAVVSDSDVCTLQMANTLQIHFSTLAQLTAQVQFVCLFVCLFVCGCGEGGGEDMYMCTCGSQSSLIKEISCCIATTENHSPIDVWSETVELVVHFYCPWAQSRKEIISEQLQFHLRLCQLMVM